MYGDDDYGGGLSYSDSNNLATIAGALAPPLFTFTRRDPSWDEIRRARAMAREANQIVPQLNAALLENHRLKQRNSHLEQCLEVSESRVQICLGNHARMKEYGLERNDRVVFLANKLWESEAKLEELRAEVKRLRNGPLVALPENDLPF